MAVFSTGAHAEALDVSIFPTQTTSQGIASLAPGPDGNMWFTMPNENKIAKSTPGGVITEYDVPTANSAPSIIAPGPDGNMWFTEQSGHNVGKITMGGTITEYSTDPIANLVPLGIVSGPDGNLWVGAYPASGAVGRIIKVTPSGAMTDYSVSTDMKNVALVKFGADGNLWFTSGGGAGTENRVGKITLSGVITEYLLPDLGTATIGITLGGDGNIWYSRIISNSEFRIGKISPSGSIQEFALPSESLSQSLTATLDGQVWFADFGKNQISKISNEGAITGYDLPEGTLPYSLGIDNEGNLWFGTASSSIGKVNSYSGGTTPVTLSPGLTSAPSSPRTGRVMVASIVTSALFGLVALSTVVVRKRLHHNLASTK